MQEFLDRLASRSPAPGGGAAAALHAAQGAALLAMVARYSDGPKYAGHAPLITAVLTEAEELRGRAVALVAEDAEAFAAVAAAYKGPREVLAAALVDAARPPAAVIAVAARLVALAEDLLPVGNRNVVTDVAAAAEAARAAVTTSRVNVEVNLAGITDPDARRDLLATLAGVDELVARADRVTADVREGLAA
ncbi:cyclodeaminase/cyclohydrolase family protein [Longispora sp. NPDC051575]|uniref:cyclodeaminase/cyclohydrolase family protein n=1 Tax=Longispora sp. NPDC051575 TaxID=3154943 RepID=UPI00342FDD6E